MVYSVHLCGITYLVNIVIENKNSRLVVQISDESFSVKPVSFIFYGFGDVAEFVFQKLGIGFPENELQDEKIKFSNWLEDSIYPLVLCGSSKKLQQFLN